jgi:hypothetical protein
MNEQTLQSRLSRAQLIALVIGIIALLFSGLGAWMQHKQFFYSYLYAWLFWMGLSSGCFIVTMIHQLTGGRWGYPTRRFFEAGFSAFPLMLVLFIPVLMGTSQIYPWAVPSEVASDPVLLQRSGYQNIPGFVIRTLIFFAITGAMAWPLRKWSLEQDATTDAEPTRKARTLSGPGVVAYSLIATFIYVDWILSLEKKWYSTMFAVIILSGQVLVTYAFGVIMLTIFRNQSPISQVVNKTHYHHLGNLLLTFVLFWTYVSFGQLLIIYSGDIPQEIDWYLHRMAGNWKFIIGALALFHFFVPFFLLLFRTMKRHIAPLTTLAILIFIMHIIDAYWLVMPAYHHAGVAVSWIDFTTLFGIAGLWVAMFLWRLKAAPLLPQHDPGIQFAFVYAH